MIRLLFSKRPKRSFEFTSFIRKLTLIALIFPVTLLANGRVQDLITVTGTITEEETNEPIIGASILLQGSTKGVMTDFDGNYSIEVPSDATLIISYIGYAKQYIKVNSRTTIDVVMTPEASELDEVVVVGYGTQTKESVVGSISQVSGDA